MNRRGVKSAVMAAVLTESTAVGVGMAATPASAGPTDNNNASVVEQGWGNVQGVPANGNLYQCPSGNFCMWTGTNYTGTMFPLYYCGTYDLYGWNGYGSLFNNETGNPPPTAVLYFQNPNSNIGIPGDYSSPNWDFSPIWHVSPC